MRKKEFLVLFSVLFTILILAPFGVDGQIELENPLTYDTFEELVEHFTNFLFYIALALTPLMVVIGAFYILTAGGNPERVKTGQKFAKFRKNS